MKEENMKLNQVRARYTIDLNTHIYWCNSPFQYDADMDYKSFEDDFM